MSLFINDNIDFSNAIPEGCLTTSHPDIERLDKYLALIESNKKSSQFVPTDAYTALDMAAHTIAQLKQNNANGISVSRLALALVQPCCQVPVH